MILGRAGQVILRGRPDVLHVRVIAPAELRSKRIAERSGVAVECAAAQVEASDKNRQSYLRRFYQARLDDPLLYHLTLNTERLNVRQAVEVITRAVEVLGH